MTAIRAASNFGSYQAYQPAYTQPPPPSQTVSALNQLEAARLQSSTSSPPLPSGLLTVRPTLGVDLRNTSTFLTQSPYCKITVGGKKWETKPCKGGGTSPVWSEEGVLSVPATHAGQYLFVEVKTKRALSTSVVIGSGKARATDIPSTPSPLSVPLYTPSGDRVGSVTLTISFSRSSTTNTFSAAPDFRAAKPAPTPNAPPPPPSSSSPSALAAVRASKIAELLAMGFPEAAASLALTRADGSVRAAVASLLSPSTDRSGSHPAAQQSAAPTNAAANAAQSNGHGSQPSLPQPYAPAAAPVHLHNPHLSPPTGPRLAAGWEERRDEGTGRAFFVNHAERATSWTHPGWAG